MTIVRVCDSELLNIAQCLHMIEREALATNKNVIGAHSNLHANRAIQDRTKEHEITVIECHYYQILCKLTPRRCKFDIPQQIYSKLSSNEKKHLNTSHTEFTV